MSRPSGVRARGSLDVVIKLERPPAYSPESGCQVVVSLPKARGIKGDSAVSVETQLIPHERDSTALVWSYKRKTVADRDRVLELAAQGLRPKEIIQATGVPKSTVYLWLEQAKNKKPSRP